jgi:hypothetical protein
MREFELSSRAHGMHRRSLGERYLDHYERFFRSEPAEAPVFRGERGSPSIQVLSFDRVFKGCRVFATLGASHYQAELGGPWEIVCVVDAHFASVPLLLANAIQHAAAERLSLADRRTIGSLEKLDPAFVGATGKSAIYISTVHGLPPEFSEIADTPGVKLRGAFFISADETRYLATNGWERFEERLEAGEVDPFSVCRPSAL